MAEFKQEFSKVSVDNYLSHNENCEIMLSKH